MRARNKVVAISLTLGLSVWFFDALVDYLVFHEGTFLELLLYDVQRHELFDRSTIFVDDSDYILGRSNVETISKIGSASDEIAYSSAFNVTTHDLVANSTDIYINKSAAHTFSLRCAALIQIRSDSVVMN